MQSLSCTFCRVVKGQSVTAALQVHLSCLTTVSLQMSGLCDVMSGNVFPFLFAWLVKSENSLQKHTFFDF